LLGRKLRHLVSCLRILLHCLLRYSLEADLLVHRKGRCRGDSKNQQKRQPPTGAAKDVEKRLAWRNKRIHHALDL